MSNSFYGKLYAETYDIGDERHGAQRFYLQQWEACGRPMPALEPMCGTGFFLLPFLQAGCAIDGLDSSPHMLTLCRDKCTKEGYTPGLYEQSLEQMDIPKQYAFAFIPDRSFAHIYEKESAHRCLVKLFEHIAPEGWFIVEVKAPPKEGEFGAPGQVTCSVDDRSDGSTIFSTSVWGIRDSGRVIRNWTKLERYLQGHLIETEIFDYNERFYEMGEFGDMLTKAGFVNITTKRAYDGGSPQEHDVIVYVCQRP